MQKISEILKSGFPKSPAAKVYRRILAKRRLEEEILEKYALLKGIKVDLRGDRVYFACPSFENAFLLKLRLKDLDLGGKKPGFRIILEALPA